MAQAPAAPNPIILQPQSSSWLDTPIQVVSTVVSIAKSALDELVAALSNIKDSPSALVKALKLGGLAILSTRMHTKNNTLHQPIAMRINNNINLMDTFCIFDDANVFISGQYRDLNLFDKLSNGFFLTADIGGFVLWLDELRLTKFATLADSVGISAKYFGSSLTTLAGLGFAAMGISKAYKLVNELRSVNPNPARTRQITIELAWAVTEVVSKTFLLLGVANIFVIGGLGLIGLSALATSIGIISFVHNRRFDRQINAA